jgi:hypothetical protein
MKYKPVTSVNIVMFFMALFFCPALKAQFSFTSTGTVYTQDFETFAGTLATLPVNWANSFNDYSPGGYYSNTGSYSNALSTYALNQNGAGEYAIGSKIAASGGLQGLTLSCANNIPNTTINSLTILWDAEQYSTGGRATTVGLINNLGGTITGSNLVTATTGTSSNLGSVIVTPGSVTYSGLSIANGAAFSLVWNVSTGTGSGDNAHLGIDNVQVSVASFTLPIVLSRFEAALAGSAIAISFSTASERNNAYFSIERSAEGIMFKEVGQLAGAGDSDTPQDYHFTDSRPLSGKNYYRLKQVDFDSKYTYSKVVSVNVGNTGGISLSPMPAGNDLQVSLDKAMAEDGVWQVLDMNGRVLRMGVLAAESLDCHINVADLPEGAFVFRLLAGQEMMVKQFWKR